MEFDGDKLIEKYKFSISSLFIIFSFSGENNLRISSGKGMI